jgi:hypothetical protein
MAPTETAPTAPPVTAGDVARLLAADATVKAADRALQRAKADRDALRERLAQLVPYDVELAAHGHKIVRRRKSTGKRLALTDYAARYGVPKRMAPFVSESFYDAWTIAPLED